ncbi:MAG: glycosyltransferase family 4 protein [Lachnospiraceae bacterium]|nr:glycosyltransferase family 4 protein [Lachnospiraceae bacterium]
MLTVGYWDQNYPEKRNIIYSGEHTEAVTYIPIHRKKNMLVSRMISRNVPCSDVMKNVQEFHYHSAGRKPYDLIHCYNGTCAVPDMPWVSTSEGIMPRMFGIEKNGLCAKAWKRYAYELTAGKYCKALFFLCRDTYEGELRQLRQDYGGVYYKDIAVKAKVLHPPQKINITQEELQEKFSDTGERLELMLVGSAFWLKGGKETVEVLEPFAKEHPIHLTIVSDFNTLRAEMYGYTKEDYRACLQRIQRNHDWITVYNKLPNRQVLKLMNKSHIGLLPSYGDSYGFSVLEFQASGCPVITTDHRAFPEINPSDCGWLTQIGGKHNGILERREDNKKQMSCIIEDILEHPEQIVKKAQKSVERIREQHDPGKHAETLLAEYRKALDK